MIVVKDVDVVVNYVNTAAVFDVSIVATF